MRAVFGREFRSYFTNIVGYIFIALFLFLSGILFSFYNVYGEIANLSYIFYSLSGLLTIMIPLLTMKLFAEDKKNKVDTLLYTSPISLGSIVLGKFLAALCVLLATLAVTLVYPAIGSFWGQLPMTETLVCYLGFILLCATLISMGLFISSISENQLAACIATFGVFLLLWLGDTLAPNINESSLFDIISSISIFSHFSKFTMGILSVSSIVYLLSITGMFLVFTRLMLSKRKCC